MAKIELDSVQSGLSVTTLNSNFQKISEALNTKVLWRDNPDGEVNFLQQDLDFNGFAPININVTAFLQDVSEALAELQEQMEALTEDLVEFRAEVDDALVEINTATDQAQQAVVDAQAQVGIATEQAELAESYAASINPSSFLLKANNLSDLADVDEARTNLGITDAPLASCLMMSVDDSVVPPGYLLANGAGVSVTYPELRALYLAQGSPYGVDGAGNPRLPDMGGYFPRGWRTGQTVDSGRVFGTVQGDAIRNITGIFHGGDHSEIASGVFAAGANIGTITGGTAATKIWSLDASRVVPTADENRPANITFTFWIKAYPAVVDTGSIDLAELANDIQGVGVRTTALETSHGSLSLNLAGALDNRFDGLPEGIAEFTLGLEQMKPSTNTNFLLRLGTLSGISSAGYYGASGNWGSAASYVNNTTGILLLTGLATNTFSCQVRFIRRPGSNWWTYQGFGGYENSGYMLGCGGRLSLGEALTTVQITKADGAGVFTNGVATLSWRK